jgi:Nucleotidyl transferase AbiEii toxin, Type IV TA system
MKDYFDIYLLARLYAFDGELLAQAISATFTRRGTPVESTPIGLPRRFSADPSKVAQWVAFSRRSRLEEVSSLDAVVCRVAAFAEPVLTVIAAGQIFTARW